ncbi:MAG: hypothetical protein MJY83_07210 [Bacteroidales bacterium]|nr:hypothetical protein [Bacteroidales bacterium]
MTIAVDFDGTIVEHCYPEIGREEPFAIDTLKKLAADGHRLILWTVREGKLLDDAVSFCHERGLDFYAVNSDYPGGSWNENAQRKVVVDMYIDDRNLGGIPDWNTIYEMVTAHLSYADLLERASAGAGTEIHSGTFKEKKNSRGKRRRHRSLIGRIIDRCREARSKFSRR